MPWLPIPCGVMRLDNEEQAVALWLYREAWSCGFLPVRCSLRQVAKRNGFCRLKLTSALRHLQNSQLISFTTNRKGTKILVKNPLEEASKPQTAQNATTFSNHESCHQIEPQTAQNATTKSEVDADNSDEVNPQSGQGATTVSNHESCHPSEPLGDHRATNTVYKENIHTTRARERDAHTREEPQLVKVAGFPGGEAMWVETVEGDQRSGFGRLANKPACSDELELGDLVAYEPVEGQQRPMFMAVVGRRNEEPVSREDFDQVAVVYAGILAVLTDTATQKPKYDDQRKSSVAVGLKKLIRQHDAAEVIATLRWLENYGGELRDEVAAGRRVWLSRRWRKIRRGYQASKHTPPPRRPKAAAAAPHRLDQGQHKAVAGKLLLKAMQAQRAGHLQRMSLGLGGVSLTEQEIVECGGEVERFKHALAAVGGLRGFDRPFDKLSTDFGWAYAKFGAAQ